MLEIDLVTLFYMFFRLAPFIIVCYFTLSSIINQDIKGIIYLVGLIVTCFLCIIIGNMFPENESVATQSNVCATFTLGNTSISKFPLSIAILTYTFAYLIFVITKYNLWITNIPTVIVFGLLLVCDFIWNTSYNCFGPEKCAASFVIASGIGIGWSYIIDSFGQPELQYFNVGSNQQV